MPVFSLDRLDATARLVRGMLPETSQLQWPQLSQRLMAEVWVKHENHLPTGAFKVRGGLAYLEDLRHNGAALHGVIAATRGNHGQRVAFAARRLGLRAVIAVPVGNGREKNAAMRALGAELVEVGHDFQAAREWSIARAEAEGLHLVPPWHPLLVRGVATAGLELLRAVPDLEVVFVPVGMGSGLCAMIAARDALGHQARIIGVAAEGAPAYAISFRERRPVNTARADTIADGVATRTPDPEALAMILAGAEDLVTVSEASIRRAMRHYFTDIHQVAEGAAAAALAAAEENPGLVRGRKVGLMLTGGNVDREVYAEVLADRD
jgi:threonine dehydratase